MEEIFNEPCNSKYKIIVNKEDIGYKYRNLSPFEFKNTLISIAEKNIKSGEKILDAGRGNPNFFSTIPRYAFGLLQILATFISNKSENNIGFIPEEKGIGAELKKLIKMNIKTHTGKFLLAAFEKMKEITKFSEDKLAYDLVISVLGCIYPNPPRIQPYVEPVLSAFLSKTIYNNDSLKNQIKIFPTEGASAAIIYVFNSLKYNNLVVEGDQIGIFTPIFSTYLEIPALQNYNLVQICIKANPENNWEIDDNELAKLGEKKIKALFICNPTNPTALSLSKSTIRKIASIVRKNNPNLIILADNVYAPFVDQFNSLLNELPQNTIGVYSFSKYFGVTGWRLGAIAIHNDNIIDNILLKKAPSSVNKRYSMISTEPQKIPFIERLVMDSRQIAEAHTAGLSTPQQVLMTLFAMFDYIDTDRVYNKQIKTLLKTRINLLLKPIKYELKESVLNSNYYIVLDLIKVAKSLTNDHTFCKYLEEHKNPFEFLILLAHTYSTVLLPAVGFAGPFWAVRVCIANLDTKKYSQIGINIKNMMMSYYQQYKKQT